MKQIALVVSCVVLLSVGAALRTARPPMIAEDSQSLEEKYTPTESEVAEIRSLIHDLREIADPHVGLSPTMSGTGFAPVPWAVEMHGDILMNHGLKASPAFARLVEYGPKALPYLLEALDDSTETGLTVEHGGGFGGMRYAAPPPVRWVTDSLPWPPLRELNPARPIEQELLDEAERLHQAGLAPKRRRVPSRIDPDHDVSDDASADDTLLDLISRMRQFHTITVGDVCYVIIGQIVNRTYMAVQYQPTALIYITSPVGDADVRAFVRRSWESHTPAQSLYDSLLLDFRTDYTSSAALRLAFYFPEESEAVFLDYLERLSLTSSEERHRWNRSWRTLKAMTVTPNKVVRQRIAEIMLETNDPHLFSIAVRAVPQADASLAFQQTNELIEVLRRDHGQESWSLDLVFESLCDTFPNRCAGFFAEFLHSATTQEAIELCFALRYTDTDVPVGSILAPLLKDERTTDYWSEPVRLRDFAAKVIGEHEASVEFDFDASEEERDVQIARMWQHCTGIGVRSQGVPSD